MIIIYKINNVLVYFLLKTSNLTFLLLSISTSKISLHTDVKIFKSTLCALA